MRPQGKRRAGTAGSCQGVPASGTAPSRGLRRPCPAVAAAASRASPLARRPPFRRLRLSHLPQPPLEAQQLLPTQPLLLSTAQRWYRPLQLKLQQLQQPGAAQ